MYKFQLPGTCPNYQVTQHPLIRQNLHQGDHQIKSAMRVLLGYLAPSPSDETLQGLGFRGLGVRGLGFRGLGV